MKYNKIILMIIVILFMFTGCGQDKKLERDYYGNELYNASYAYIENDKTLHIIPLMSKENITKVIDIQVASEGGTYDLKYSVEDGDYDYEDFHLYRICLEFSNVKFEEDCINVSEMKLFYDGGKEIVLLLDKCQIKSIEGTYNNEPIDINGSPLRMPSDMTSIPLELSSNEGIDVTNIYVTNEDMKLSNYVGNDGNLSDVFQTIPLLNDGNTIYWSADFTVGTEEIDSYKNYCTTIVIQYTYDGKQYYVIPAVPRTIYNPFDAGYDGIENYFKYLEGK